MTINPGFKRGQTWLKQYKEVANQLFDITKAHKDTTIYSEHIEMLQKTMEILYDFKALTR